MSRAERFSLGDLPAGSQVLEVRRIGCLFAQRPVELRAGRTLSQDVRLQRSSLSPPCAFWPSARGVTSLTARCEVHIVMDGMREQDVDLIHPSSVVGIDATRREVPFRSSTVGIAG